VEFRRVVELYPKSELAPFALYSAGYFSMKASDWNSALEAFNRLLKDYSQHGLMREAAASIGDCYYQQKKYSDAVTAYRKSLSLIAGEALADTQEKIGDSLAAQNLYEDALTEYLKVVILYKSFERRVARSQYKAGQCYEQLGKWFKAKRTYQELIDEHPKDEWTDKARERIKAIGDQSDE
ncbi:MAG: tetratricopeptide repeat protein, partial [bacterium]|nr:tetratricopeptide repeat protein [bacterium]